MRFRRPCRVTTPKRIVFQYKTKGAKVSYPRQRGRWNIGGAKRQSLKEV